VATGTTGAASATGALFACGVNSASGGISSSTDGGAGGGVSSLGGAGASTGGTSLAGFGGFLLRVGHGAKPENEQRGKNYDGQRRGITSSGSWAVAQTTVRSHYSLAVLALGNARPLAERSYDRLLAASPAPQAVRSDPHRGAFTADTLPRSAADWRALGTGSTRS